MEKTSSLSDTLCLSIRAVRRRICVRSEESKLFFASGLSLAAAALLFSSASYYTDCTTVPIKYVRYPGIKKRGEKFFSYPGIWNEDSVLLIIKEK